MSRPRPCDPLVETLVHSAINPVSAKFSPLLLAAPLADCAV